MDRCKERRMGGKKEGREKQNQKKGKNPKKEGVNYSDNIMSIARQRKT